MRFPPGKTKKSAPLLGQFLFSGETVFKPVFALSGGEKARLALAKMLLRPVNLMVLDEPTNHLDIPAKEMLENALIDYDGTVLIVSHDRYFISQVANKIVEVHNGELLLYNGNYDYYLEKKEEAHRKADLEAKRLEEERKKKAKREKQKQKQREKKLAKLK